MDVKAYQIIAEEAVILEAVRTMSGQEDWDGNPRTTPQYTMKAWWIDPYWYVMTTDGAHRVVSNDQVRSIEDLVECIQQQIRILTGPQYRKE